MTATVAPVETEIESAAGPQVCSVCEVRGCALGLAQVVMCVRSAPRATGDEDARNARIVHFGCDGTGYVRTIETHHIVPCPNCQGIGRFVCRCLLCHP